MTKALPFNQLQSNPPIFVPVTEVARRLGIGQTSVWMLIRNKALPVVKIGRRTLVATASLEEFASRLISSRK